MPHSSPLRRSPGLYLHVRNPVDGFQSSYVGVFTALDASAQGAHWNALFSTLLWQDPLLVFPNLSRHPLQKEDLTAFQSSTHLYPADPLTCPLGRGPGILSFFSPNLESLTSPPKLVLCPSSSVQMETHFHMSRYTLQKWRNYFRHFLLSSIFSSPFPSPKVSTYKLLLDSLTTW